MDPKDIDKLSKKDRLTDEISPRMVEEIVKRLERLENGEVAILVKDGLVLGIEVKDRVHFAPRGT